MECIQENKFIANRLRQIASLLEEQGANRFRVAAYRKAADTVEGLQEDIGLILRSEGFEGLTSLVGIGRQIGGSIAEMIRTGHSSQLERLHGTSNPELLFNRVPGIDAKLALRIVEELHIDTLEGLEIAAYDGRLDKVAGFGTRRLEMVRAALTQMLGRRRADAGPEPYIDFLLDVDREYREKANANQLRHIAPKRFNPTSEAWLPVLHTERGTWTFTVLYSNTALAHNLGRAHDWVVIYFQHDSHRQGQRTVVTEPRSARRQTCGSRPGTRMFGSLSHSGDAAIERGMRSRRSFGDTNPISRRFQESLHPRDPPPSASKARDIPSVFWTPSCQKLFKELYM